MKTLIYLSSLLIVVSSYSQTSIIKNWDKKLSIKKDLVHTKPSLNTTIYLVDAEIAPSYSGCENLKTNTEKTNCLITNLDIYTNTKIEESPVFKNCKLKKGVNKVRVLLIIDKTGQIQVKKILGEWSNNISNEFKKILESAPIIIPAKQSEKNIAVKFSIKIPFYLK